MLKKALPRNKGSTSEGPRLCWGGKQETQERFPAVCNTHFGSTETWTGRQNKAEG